MEDDVAGPPGAASFTGPHEEEEKEEEEEGEAAEGFLLTIFFWCSRCPCLKIWTLFLWP